MLKLFRPMECRTSVREIDLASLRAKGIRGLILDLDNTIVEFHRRQVPTWIIDWVNQARRMGFSVLILSNARRGRVSAMSKVLDVPGIAIAIKPFRRPFRKALAMLGCAPSEVAVIGDQIFTDVLGGNRLGLYTILTNPLSNLEFPTTRLVRKVEKWLLKKMKEHGLISHEDWLRRTGCSLPPG